MNENKKIYLEKLKIINEIVHPFIRDNYVSYLNSEDKDIQEKFKKINELDAELKNRLSRSNLHNT